MLSKLLRAPLFIICFSAILTYFFFIMFFSGSEKIIYIWLICSVLITLLGWEHYKKALAIPLGSMTYLMVGKYFFPILISKGVLETVFVLLFTLLFILLRIRRHKIYKAHIENQKQQQEQKKKKKKKNRKGKQ